MVAGADCTTQALEAMERSRTIMLECFGEYAIEYEYELRRHTRLYMQLGADDDKVR